LKARKVWTGPSAKDEEDLSYQRQLSESQSGKEEHKKGADWFGAFADFSSAG
jgi:hypothetical protein